MRQCIAFLVLAVFGTLVRADITFSMAGTGSYSIDRRERGADGKWEIDVTALVGTGGASPYQLTIFARAQAQNDSIGYIRITANRSAQHPDSFVVLSIAPNGFPTTGTIPIIREISKVGGNADVVLGADLIGQFGESGVNGPGSINVSKIGLIVARKNLNVSNYPGHIYADITVAGASFTSHDAEQVWAEGSLFGNILVDSGSLLLLNVAGDIGTSSAPVTIDTFGNIPRLEGDNTFAAISTR